MGDLSNIHNELVAIRSLLTTTSGRVEQIATRQDELIQTVDGLTASVDKLNTSITSIKAGIANALEVGDEEVAELRQKITDVADTMGAAVVNVHRDFAMILHQVGPAFEQVQRTVGPFAEAVSSFAADPSPLYGGGAHSSSAPGHPPHGATWPSQQQH